MVSAKVLGKAKPAATTDTTIYVVPGATEAQCNLFVCNQGGSASLVRVALIESGGTLSVDDYIVYDLSLPANITYPITGLALSTGTTLSVRSDTGNVSFVATGLEIT